MSTYYYRRQKNCNMESKRCLITVEPSLDVETAIYESLAKCKSILFDDIKTQYCISEIEPACDGCLNDCFGQEDHMACPYGCLHDRTTCTFCNN